MCCAGAVQVLELYYMKTGDERFDDAAHELNMVRRHFLCTIAPPKRTPDDAHCLASQHYTSNDAASSSFLLDDRV